MLRRISVENYILIESLEIEFSTQFSVLTGETGSGKSILLDALGLARGNRADTATLKDKSRKCVVEAEFDIERYNLRPFFEANDLDYADRTLLRREITPQGKSRAFVNDTPVNLSTLKDLSSRLIDIHSQHQTLLLSNAGFQLGVVDMVAATGAQLSQYQTLWRQLGDTRRDIDDLRSAIEIRREKADFLQFQLEQLRAAKLRHGELEELELEQNTLNNSELIITTLAGMLAVANGGDSAGETDSGALPQLRQMEYGLGSLYRCLPQSAEWQERIKAIRIELGDVVAEIERYTEGFEYDPRRAQQVEERVGEIYSLLHKHRMQSVAELLEYQAKLESEEQEADSSDEKLAAMEGREAELLGLLQSKAQEISKIRQSVFKKVASEVQDTIRQLGMNEARFCVERRETPLASTGIDDIRFLIATARQSEPDDIGKIASGGELSRVMLAIKALMCANAALPTIIFDEIDTGISGDIADKMARIMLRMSAGMQVISITHLPQVAARAQSHYVARKESRDAATVTTISRLSDEERVVEVARMLSGEQLSQAAIENAKDLIFNS